ncbi:hypothetical protein LAZ67_2004553 [Cordylochernes scorpioides]|uniref:Uncharacterized protein n=1 Tax=Cordylochernes scorpioides TaxID=51811 RepID=A0ABY6K4U8_9ARAC|nr:hypothetical protein LAZ67_2004553 [Cordylochernes scorpioides]
MSEQSWSCAMVGGSLGQLRVHCLRCARGLEMVGGAGHLTPAVGALRPRGWGGTSCVLPRVVSFFGIVVFSPLSESGSDSIGSFGSSSLPCSIFLYRQWSTCLLVPWRPLSCRLFGTGESVISWDLWDQCYLMLDEPRCQLYRAVVVEGDTAGPKQICLENEDRQYGRQREETDIIAPEADMPNRGRSESLPIETSRQQRDSGLVDQNDGGISVESSRSPDPEASNEGPILRRNPPRKRRPPSRYSCM